MAIFADSCFEKVTNLAISWLASLVPLVVNASIDWRSRVGVVHTVVEDLANIPVGAGNDEVAQADWNVSALIA